VTRKEYRKRKVANDYRRSFLKRGEKFSVTSAYKQTDAIEKVCAALGNLSVKSRTKVLKMLQIWIAE